MQGYVAQYIIKHRRRFAKFLAMLAVFALCDVSLASAEDVVLYDNPRVEGYKEAWSPWSGSDWRPVYLSCDAVGGSVTSVTAYMSGYSNPSASNIRMVLDGRVSDNATTSVSYPPLPFTFSFDPPVDCLSGTSTITWSVDSGNDRFTVEWKTGATSTQYIPYDSTKSMTMLVSGFFPSDPVATTSTSTLSSLATGDFVFMLSILLFFMSFAFIAWIYEHNFFPRI